MKAYPDDFIIIKGMDMPSSCRECPFVMVSMRWEEPYAIKCVVSPRREITSTLSRQSWCPLVETIEPKHGHWIVDEDGNIECSVCGNSGVGDNFCERCGAKMDEVTE